MQWVPRARMHSPGDPGVRVGLADADDPVVGMDLDDQVVLRRGARRGVVVGDQEDVQVDAR